MMHPRRGNALILVAAVLVLLVIIAAVFLSRTSTLRQVGAAQRQNSAQQHRTKSASEEVVQQLSNALFVKPIEYTDEEFDAALPVVETRRSSAAADAPRYGVDEQFSWNRAPHEVIPWTNPPDWLTWPMRPGPWRELYEDGQLGNFDTENWVWTEDRTDGPLDLFAWPANYPANDPSASWPNPDMTNQVVPVGRNPIGGPGIGDTRWLRDLEPQRIASRSLHDLNSFAQTDNPFNDRFLDGFSHWRHLSYIGTPENGWRMCPDIADVTGVRTFNTGGAGWESSMTIDGVRHGEGGWVDGRTYYGGVMERLDIPIEQWPATVPMRVQGGGFGNAQRYDRHTDVYLTDGDTLASTFTPDDGAVVIPATADPATFPTWVSGGVWDFWDRWLAWLRPEGHRLALAAARENNGAALPPNFYDLSDLDGDGLHHEVYNPSDISSGLYLTRPGERPEDEFNPGTARWNVSRILTDADGDGFTDSFWWLSPHIGQDGTRQVVGVSVTDNSGRFNANVATRSIRNDQAGSTESTRGWTPADLALVGQNYGVAADVASSDAWAPSDAPVWNVGFFDAAAHQPNLLEKWVHADGQQQHPFFGSHNADQPFNTPLLTYNGDGTMPGTPSDEQVAWDPGFWRDTPHYSMVDALNIRWSPIFPDFQFGGSGLADTNDRDNRLAYFQMGGQNPQDPQNVFTPFNLADELELRAYEGNNHPWVDSRLERATGRGYFAGATSGSGVYPLRGNSFRNESSEAGEQLDNRQLSFDLRHRLTAFSGARNETLPAHLWWESRAPLPRISQIDYGDFYDGPAQEPTNIAHDIAEDLHARFAKATRRKLDLREYERPTPSLPTFQAEFEPQKFSDRLAHSIMLALTSGDVTARDEGHSIGTPVDGGRDSYFGTGDAAWERTRRKAAAMAANVLAMRDTDHDAPLYSMEGYPSGKIDSGQPVLGWYGEVGAMPLPVFEHPYDPVSGDLLFPGTDLWGDDPAASAPGNDDSPSDDFLDLGDVTLREAIVMGTNGPAIADNHPWGSMGIYVDLDDDGDADYEDVRARGFEGEVGGRVLARIIDTVGDDTPSLSEVNDWLGDPAQFPLASNFREVPAWGDQYNPETHMLGVEAQPFIAEAFFAVVGRPWQIPEFPEGAPPPDPGGFGNDETGGGGSQGNGNPYLNAESWTWATSYDPYAEGGDSEYNEIVNQVQAAAPYFGEKENLPVPPRVVFAVQLINPYPDPIPLLDRNNQPIYSLRLFRPDRLDPTSPATWTIPLDPRGIDLEMSAATELGADRMPVGTVNWADSVPVIPPATNDRPYSLMVVMNGVDATRDAMLEQFEAARWMDFLDAEAELHPWSDTFANPYAGDQPNDTRTIESGELIWSLKPDDILPSLASAWYAPDVGGGSASGFTGPQIDPSKGVAIELVRRHARSWDAPSQGTLADYATDVVIDRSVGNHGIDEFVHVVTHQLAQHRQPGFRDSAPPHPPNNAWSTEFPTFAQFTADGGEGDSSVGFSESWLYPMPLMHDANNPDAPEGYSSLDPSLRIPPWKARWMQWARYARPWAVDDYDEVGTIDPEGGDVDVALERVWDSSWNAALPTASRRWRPDRAAPRFVASEGRVTRSWSRPWATRLGAMPNAPGSSGDGGGKAFPYHAGTGQQHVLRNATWDPGNWADVGPPWELEETLGVTAGEDPLLVAPNLSQLTSTETHLMPADLTKASVRVDRRYAEQKALYPSHGQVSTDPLDGTDLLSWSSWVVTSPNDQGNDVTRNLRVLVDNDPEDDLGLPRSANLFDADLVNDWPIPPPGSQGSTLFDQQWGVGWYRTSTGLEDEFGNAVYGSAGAEVADTYASLLRYRHGHIYNVDWDPDGLGRVDDNGDGEWDTAGGNNAWEHADAYSFENPYPHPWATRNHRLPWTYGVDADSNQVLEAEYRVFQASKPSFFAFAPTRAINNALRPTDPGYDPTAAFGNYSAVWSYPDKGLYGPDEIDGDILMPFGFQVAHKNGNFEQIGEALNAFTVAHELHLPLQYSNTLTEMFPSHWYAWPPAPLLPDVNGNFAEPLNNLHPLYGTPKGVATLRTFSEGISAELADAGAHAGRLRLTGAKDGLNAVIGEQPVDLSEMDEIDPEYNPPPWYLTMSDVRHLEPDLPAGQRMADLFVCDGPGIWDLESNITGEFGPDGFIDHRGSFGRFTSSYGGVSSTMPRRSEFDLAAGFRGDATRGLININTAPAEVMRAMPQMYRLVHAGPSGGSSGSAILDAGVGNHDQSRSVSPHPRSGIPEAMVQYRDRLGHQVYDSSVDPGGIDGQDDVDSGDLSHTTTPQIGILDPGTAAGPMYSDRGSAGIHNPVSIDELYGDGVHGFGFVDQSLDTDAAITQSRGTRGFAGIGELFQLTRPALYGFEINQGSGSDDRDPLGNSLSRDAWRIDWAARNPFGYQDEQVHGANMVTSQLVGNANPDPRDATLSFDRRRSLVNPGAFLSTDTGRFFDGQVFDLSNHEYVAEGPWGSSTFVDPLLSIDNADPRHREILLTGDRVASDAEESNLLFSGISNLITTRSDVFTVHLKVRTFKQNPDTKVWDALDPDYIVSDERYVLVVDRSNVERPGDRPRILLMDRIDH